MASHVSTSRVDQSHFPGLAAPWGSRLQRDTPMRGCSSLWGSSYREPEAKSLRLLIFPLGDPESWPMGLATVLAEVFLRQAASGRDWAWEEPLLGQGRACRTPACDDSEEAGYPNTRSVQGCQVLPQVQGRPQSHLGVTAEDAAGWREWYGKVSRHGRPQH